MIVTDTLNGHTIEDVRRNQDGSVTMYCDSGRTLTLHVENGVVEVKPEKLILPDSVPIEAMPSDRMRLLQAFQGYTVNYAHHNDSGGLVFVCEPLRSTKEKYAKSCGHREVAVSHSNGFIDELPPVSAIITMPSLSVFGEQHQ